jgi:hypothetical protein
MFIVSIVALAQDHPDFSGTWTVSHVDVQNQPNSNVSRGGGGFGGGIGGRGGRGGFGRRGGFGGGGGGRGSGGGQRRQGGRAGNVGLSQGDTLRISQTPERLIVTRTSPDGDVMTSYTLDGKETKNHPSPDVEVKSKSKWDGVALVTDSTQTVDNGQGNKFSTKTREILSLSADGQTLTSTMTASTAFGKRTVTATLTKQGAPVQQ